jgi:uncharacterized protein YbaR (Trm112 family)
MALKKGPKFYCDICDFKCSKGYNWARHLATDKHKMALFGTKKKELKKGILFCDEQPSTFIINDSTPYALLVQSATEKTKNTKKVLLKQL